jgi:hypothetical protein
VLNKDKIEKALMRVWSQGSRWYSLLSLGGSDTARLRRLVTLDPNRPTPQVSNIAQSILSELDGARGTAVTVTLHIHAKAADGFPEDIESVVRYKRAFGSMTLGLRGSSVLSARFNEAEVGRFLDVTLALALWRQELGFSISIDAALKPRAFEDDESAMGQNDLL